MQTCCEPEFVICWALNFQFLLHRYVAIDNVMHQHGIKQVMTFDSGFDAFPGIERIL
jgi:hypothetical protein